MRLQWKLRAHPLVLTAVLTVFVSRAVVAQKTADRFGPPADLSDQLTAVVQEYAIPGMAAAVLRGDRVIAEGVAGVRRKGGPAITIDDQFAIASAAKAMSATVLARLVEENRISFDTSVAELFPGNETKVDPAWRNVTVRQLMQHRAGLRDHVILFAWTVSRSRGDAVAQRMSYVSKVLAKPPDFTPGSRFLYNNTDYIILGAALERRTGRIWPRLMEEELFRPLELTSAGFGPPGKAGETLQPWGHGRRRMWYFPLPFGTTAFDPEDPRADYPLAAAPSGFVHLSIRDWAAFIALHLRSHALNPHRANAFLRPETWVILHEPENNGSEYAGGWFVGTRLWARGNRVTDRGRILFHAGNNGRWTSVVYLAPEIDFAVLVVCNRGDQAEGVDKAASRLVADFARKADVAVNDPGSPVVLARPLEETSAASHLADLEINALARHPHNVPIGL